MFCLFFFFHLVFPRGVAVAVAEVYGREGEGARASRTVLSIFLVSAFCFFCSFTLFSLLLCFVFLFFSVFFGGFWCACLCASCVTGQ